MSERTEVAKVEERMPEKESLLSVLTPLVDIFENEDEILLHADMPGVHKDDIRVNIDNGKLSITGVRSLASSGAMTWQEFGEAEFRRTFSVPQSIDIEKVHAELKEGVLKLHLPKAEAAKPRKIEIRVG